MGLFSFSGSARKCFFFFRPWRHVFLIPYRRQALPYTNLAYMQLNLSKNLRDGKLEYCKVIRTKWMGIFRIFWPVLGPFFCLFLALPGMNLGWDFSLFCMRFALLSR